MFVNFCGQCQSWGNYMNVVYYKVLAKDAFSPTTQFDYSPYLPQNGKAGKWLPEIEKAQIRKAGYYVSRYWNMWYEEGCRIYEVECKGLLLGDENGVEKQACCAQIRLLKDVTESLVGFLDLSTFGEFEKPRFNTGPGNTGLRNTGSYNSGNFNTGSRNTGNLNSGDFNTGDNNTGIDNVGDNNIGSANSGCSNIGHSNSGNFNKGSYNTGKCNTGHCNTGSFNVGNSNVGKWNVGNYHCGFFNTKEAPIMMFNKPANVKISQVKMPLFLNEKDCKAAFEKTTLKDIQDALALPNFDFEIFEAITGISKADFERRLGTTL